MKLAIVGSRTFTNEHWPHAAVFVDKILGKYPDLEIISGGARGADAFAAWYARNREIPIHIYYAKWERDGKQAGFTRNVVMAEECTHVLAFWDGISSGTKMMIKTAEELKRVVHVKQFKRLDYA